MDTGVDVSVPADERARLIRDPYPFFAEMRARSGVFHGTVMDYHKTPASMRPKQNYAAMSFGAVNTVFRDGKLFNSAMYDATIGLFIGPTILALGGTTHRAHRNLVNALIDEFIDGGQTDLIKQFTFEFPTRVIARLLGLPEEDLPSFRSGPSTSSATP